MWTCYCGSMGFLLDFDFGCSKMKKKIFAKKFKRRLAYSKPRGEYAHGHQFPRTRLKKGPRRCAL